MWGWSTIYFYWWHILKLAFHSSQAICMLHMVVLGIIIGSATQLQQLAINCTHTNIHQSLQNFFQMKKIEMKLTQFFCHSHEHDLTSKDPLSHRARWKKLVYDSNSAWLVEEWRWEFSDEVLSIFFWGLLHVMLNI